MFTFDQAKAAIADKPEFTVRDKGSYRVIDYNFNDNKTFVGATPEETKILLNLRGTAFDNETGRIIRLGFHKFFNLGEQPEVDALYDVTSDEATITQKLDGSCIFPIFAREGWRLGTRAGVTDIAEMAEAFIADKPEYKRFINECWNNGAMSVQPIFEFCSRKNQVVIDHPEDKLVLIGMRWFDNGKYLSIEQLVGIGFGYGIPVVQLRTKLGSAQEIVQWVRDLKDDEGVVVSFPDGHRIKIKADDYVRKHKAVDGLRFEKDVALLIMNNSVDDVLPILAPNMQDRLTTFQRHFIRQLIKATDELVGEFVTIRMTSGGDRKVFAQHASKTKFRPFLFSMLDGKKGVLHDWIVQNCNTQANYEKVRKLLDISQEF
jgi:RNA ligase